MKITQYFLKILTICLVGLSSCSLMEEEGKTNANAKTSGNSASSEIYEGFTKAEINDVLILPVLVRSNKDGVLSSPEEVLGLPDQNSTDILLTSFDVNTSLNLIEGNSPVLKGTDYSSILNKNGLTREGLFKRAREISKELGVSHVIFCILDEKDMRTGGGYGSQRSSSLGYRIWLYDSSTDKIIWSSAYQSKQDSISSNLFEIRERLESGIGFKTSEELLKNAFRSSAKKLNQDLIKNSLKK